MCIWTRAARWLGLSRPFCSCLCPFQWCRLQLQGEGQAHHWNCSSERALAIAVGRCGAKRLCRQLEAAATQRRLEPSSTVTILHS